MTKFTMSSTTRFGTPSIILQNTSAVPDTARRRLRSSRHSPKPRAVPKIPDSMEISSVTSRPLRIICQRFSRIKVFSKLDTMPSQKLSSTAESVLATTMTVRTSLYGSEKSMASRRSSVAKRLDMMYKHLPAWLFVDGVYQLI